MQIQNNSESRLVLVMWLVRPWRSVLILLFLSFQSSQAAELEIAVTGWLSEGQSRWAHNASVLNNIWGNPTSELSYENVDSEIVEVSLTLPYNSDNLHFAIGGGTIDSGLLVDDDYVSAAGATYYGATLSGAKDPNRLSTS